MNESQSNTSMAEGDHRFDLQKYAIEQAIGRLEHENDRVDAFMVHVKWIVTVVSSIVLVVVAFVSFLGISNLNEVSRQVAEDAKTRVRFAIQQDKQNIVELATLNKNLAQAQEDYQENREAIDALSVLKDLTSLDSADPHFAYERVRRLDAKSFTPESRGAALKFLTLIIEAGEKGVADPNTLFNAAVTAAQLSLELESVKLAVLAAHWRPSRSHRARKAQATESLGKTFQLVDGHLELLDLSPAQVRKSAWNDLLEMVREAPRVEGEHIYSTSANVAVQNRSAGYQSQLAETILESERLHPNRLTSYAYLTLARMYAREGANDWEEKFWEATRAALRKLKGESPIVSWQEHSIDDIFQTVLRLDLLEPFLVVAEAEGFSSAYWNRVLNN